MLVHQVFLPFAPANLTLEQLPVYARQVEITRQNCIKFGYQYKMWDLEACEQLLTDHFPQYLQLWEDFEKLGLPVMRVDFIRYCIILKHGGTYIDCDVALVDRIDNFDREVWFAKWRNCKRNLPYIAVMGGKPGNKLIQEIIVECHKSFYPKAEMEIYKKWKGRFVFQTTGHYVCQRVIKRNKLKPEEILIDCLYISHQKSKRVIEYIGDISAPFHDLNYSYWFK